MDRHQKNSEIGSVSTNETAGTPRTSPQIDTIRTARRNRVAALIFLATNNILGMAASACGARTELHVDETAAVDVPNKDGGTDADVNPDGCMGVVDAGPDGSMGLDGGPDGSMGLECNKVNVSLMGPPSTTVAKGTTNIPALCLEVKNGCVPGFLDNMTVETQGVGNLADIEFTVAFPDGSRLSDFQPGSPSTVHTFDVFKYQLLAESARTICVFANIDPNTPAGSSYGFTYVPKASSFSNGAKLDGTPPSIAGSLFVVGSPKVGAVYIGSNDMLPPLASGKNGKVSNFAIQSVDFETPGFTEDSSLTRMSLHFDGTCDPKNISNIALFAEGNPAPICAADTPDGFHNVAHITCATPHKLPQGSTQNFYITADQTCPPGTTIKTFLLHPSDLYMQSSKFPYGERVTGFDGEGSKGGTSHVDIK